MEGRIANPENLKNGEVNEDSENVEIANESPLSETTSLTLEKNLKVVFVCLLFLVVLGSGFIARITLHILVWHINPPNEKENSTSSTLGGLLQHNCTECSKGIVKSNIACSGQDFTGVDENWIWALYLVIIVPYVWTFLSTLFRICFKTNKKLQLHILLVVVVIETFHSIGLSIMAFIVLPSFDPATASVVCLSVASLPPLLNFIDKLTKQKGKYQKCQHILSYVLAFCGFSLQIAGIILIGIYTKQAALTVLYVTATILVSVKHWENFISMGSEKSTFLPRIKREFQIGKTKVTCLASLAKIIVTFLAVITIFTSRTNKTSNVFMSLFNTETSEFYASFGERTIGDNPICQWTIPFIVAVINIVCDYLCYKAAKTACVIYCQRFGFSLPIILLPIATTFSLVGILFKPHVLKFDSCDLLFSEWCLKGIGQLGENCKEVVIAFVLLYTSIFLIAREVWKGHGFRHGESSRIMVYPFYCGMFLDLSLLLNRRQEVSENDDILGKARLNEFLNQTLITNEADFFRQSPNRPKLYACSTMWHETANEMTQLLKSILRLDKKQRINKLIAEKLNADDTYGTDSYDEETFDLEAHVFFDDAFESLKDNEKYPYVNEYVKTFMEVIDQAGSIIYGKMIQISDGEMYRTPYGARIKWKLPGGNYLIVHLKDKTKIRHKKRWSQVMYMFYILKWKIMGNGKTKTEEIQQAAENTYILALDGGVDFEPEAVLSLMRRMKKTHTVGAACGRIHPIGSGPMVWYQKFEYAVSHWLQKATEHVIGCVLCSPGCFSLFRGSAILNHNVLAKYTTVPQEAINFLQYDQGADRWLCTLLLKEGWKIEYCAESDSYTFAPEGFCEFFNQRRRWTPSTMANILDLIVDWKHVTHNNKNISLLYIVYQVFLFASTLLTPGSIFMLIFAAIIIGFPAIPPWLSLILNIIPVGVFMLMCLYSSTQLQLQFAAILSAIYAVVMVIVLIGIVKDAIEEGICSMSTIFIIFVAGVFVISAILHPKEIVCILPGLIYFIAIPSMSMLMFLYSIGNLHVLSWGTREKKQPTDSKREKKTHKPDKEETGYFCSFGSFFSCILCPTNAYTKEDFLYRNMIGRVKGIVGNNEVNSDDEKKITTIEMNEQDQETEAVAPKIPKEDKKGKRKKTRHEFRIYCDDSVPIISREEVKFWKKNIKKYLKPLDKDEEKEKKIEADMVDLRNRVCLFVFLLNTIFVTLMYALTQVNAFKDSLSVPFTCAGRDVRIVPISVMFAVVFGLLLLIQFVCMLYHRFSTLIHITAATDIIDSAETKESKISLQIAEYLTTPIVTQQPTCTSMSDKNKEVLDKNRLVISTIEKPLKNLDAIIRKNMPLLTGSLETKKTAVAKTAVQKWLGQVIMQDVVTQIVNENRMRHPPKKESNKVEPENRGKLSPISGSEQSTKSNNDASSDEIKTEERKAEPTF